MEDVTFHYEESIIFPYMHFYGYLRDFESIYLRDKIDKPRLSILVSQIMSTEYH